MISIRTNKLIKFSSVLLTAALIATVSLTPTIAAPKPKAGASCTTVGKVQNVGANKFKCTKSGNKNIWQRVKPKSVTTQVSAWGAPAVYDLSKNPELSFNFTITTNANIDLPKLTAVFTATAADFETPTQTLEIPVTVIELSRTEITRTYRGSLKLTSRDPIGQWRWKMSTLTVNNSPIAGILLDSTQEPFAFARPTFGGTAAIPVNPSAITTYNSFKNEKFQLYPWEGENLVILTKTNSLSPSIMGRILYTLNRSYQSYAAQTNFRPMLFKKHNNKATIAVLGPDEVGCGAACGYLGATGIEIGQGFFNRLYNGVEKFDQYDQVLFYELGRNFWDYGGYKFKLSINGAGNNETSHSIEQAKMAAAAGADGLLVVTPYYNKPPQAGIEAHFRAMADATDVPVMLYDIPGRTGIAIEPDTICRLAEHKNIFALKDAKGDVASTSWVIKRSGIPVYSGDDILNLPLLSVGAVGFVSVCGHTVGSRLRELLDAWFGGNSKRALEIHQELLPVYTGTFRTQGAILTKAALSLMGLPGGKVRLPLVDATAAQISQLKEDLQLGGVKLN